MNKKNKQKILLYLTMKLGWLLILFLGKVSFIKIIGRQNLQKIRKEGKSFLYVLWHGRIMIPIYVHRNEGVTAMVSLHTDGEMIAQTLHKLGYYTVRGSSTRGGNKAFHDMVEVLKNGGVGAVIPDGPRGPRHHLKPGTLYIAQQTGGYLVPITFSSSKKIIFNSWDRFIIPVPFSKSVVIYGEPIMVAKNLAPEQLEALRQRVEQQLVHLEQQADEYFRK